MKEENNDIITVQKYKELLDTYKRGFRGRSTGIVSFRECYLLFPHKRKGDKNIYYLRNDLVSNDPRALNYEEYRKILEAYVERLYLYVREGHAYNFTSGIGVIKMQKYKPKYLGHNLPKKLKEIQKEHGLSWHEAQQYIKNNRADIEFEERKNILLGGFKFKLFWYSKYTNVANIYYWSLNLIKAGSEVSSYKRFLRYYRANPQEFNKIEVKKSKIADE